jgi:hypothetical protein
MNRKGAVIQSSRLVADEHGLIPLARFGSCADAYHGQFSGASVFVIGRGTDQERLFRKAQQDDATRYAIDNGPGQDALTIDHVHATTLCHDAVVELLGA